MKTATVKTKSTSQIRTRKLVATAMLAALSAVLMFFEIPLPFLAPEFYKLDFSEIPVLIGGFALGPVSGVIIELVKVLLKLVIKGTTTGGVGDFANFLIGCAMVVPASMIYKLRKTRGGALVSMAVGTAVMALLGAVINGFVLLPVYAKAFKVPISVIIDKGKAINPAIDSVFKFCLISVTPFNIVKGVLVSAVTFGIYKPLSRVIHKFIE